MKNIILFIAGVALCFSIRAAPVFLIHPPNTSVAFTNVVYNNTQTNLQAGALATVTTNTLVQPTPTTLTHGVQWFVTFRGTNTISITAQRTIDNTNWVTWWSTNYVANQGPGTFTSSNIDFQFTGAWTAYQYVVVQASTNVATNTILINQIDQ